GAAGKGPLRRSPSPLHRGFACSPSRTGECPPASLDPRRRSGTVRPPARLSVLAALSFGDRLVPRPNSAPPRRSRRRALSLSTPARHSRGPSRARGGMSDVVLKATDLTRYYQVSRGAFRDKAILKALDGASFTVDRGKTLAVVGESGCGKSTLARIVTMIEPPTSGSLIISGKQIADAKAETLRALRPKVQI